MAIETASLTRQWIQFLKSNQIASSKSDPKTGKLSYKREVTSNDLVRFLEAKTDYDEESIYNAIHAVLVKNKKAPSRLGHTDYTDDGSATPDYPGRSGFNRDDAEDVDYRDVDDNQTRTISSQTRPGLPSPQQKKARGGKRPGVVSQTPNAIRKRNARLSKKSLKEDFVDQPITLTEKDIEDIFVMLQTPQAPAEEPKADPVDNKKEDLAKIQNLIKTSMTPEQRQYLWQALHNPALHESFEITDTRVYNNLKNDKIGVNELHQEWRRTGFSLELSDIQSVLESHGFGYSEITEIFRQTFGEDLMEDVSETSPAIDKIVNYAKEHDLVYDIIEYMRNEFADELNQEEQPDRGLIGKASDWMKRKFRKKATNEEVRQIFNAIVLKERTMRTERIRAHEGKLFGRNKK